MKMKERLLRKQSAMGEFLEFAIVMPIILLIFMVIISYYQISECEQRLIYATYRSGREAVTSYDKADALKAMGDVIAELYPGDSSVEYEIGIDDGNWVKGNVTIITVRQKLDTLLPIGRGIHQRSVGMMIEHSKWIKENVTYP